MDANPEDDRDPSTVRMDLLVDQVNALLSRMDEVIRHDHGTTQTVIHKTAGMGAWGAAAVTACMFTFLGLILMTMIGLERFKAQGDDVRDLKAWTQIHEKRINKLETKP